MVLINFIQRHRRPAAAMLAVVVLSVIWLSVPQVARAGVEEIVANMLSWLAYWLITLMANLLVVVVNILVAVAQYNNFLGAPAVERGWVIVRDIANMFFIVVLLIIAFGTILRLENYRYNRLLARLIVMAILVNFSKFIAGFFIDFGQIIMLTFVNAWRDAAAGNITHALGLTEIVQLRNQDLPNGLELNSGAILTALLLGLFLVTVAVIVLGIMAIVLILRVLALWFLIVLSPLAYLFRTYPSTEKYAARWWQEFGRYVIVGPVMAFLLWLSLAVMAAPVQFSEDVFVKVRTTEGAGVIEPTTSDTANNIAAAISTIGQSDKLLGYMTSILLLVGTLMITRELGVAGGQLAGQWAEKIRGFATKAAVVGGAGAAFGALGVAGATVGRPVLKTTGKVVGAGARGIGNALIDRAQVLLGGVPLRPSKWVEGWKRAQDRKRHDWEDKRIQASQRTMFGDAQLVTKKKFRLLKRGRGRLGFIPRPGFEEVTEPKAKPRFFWGAAGSPEYLAYNVVTAGNLLRGAMGDFRPFTKSDYFRESEAYLRMKEEAEAKEEDLKLKKAAANLPRFYTEEAVKKELDSEVEARAKALGVNKDDRADINNYTVKTDRKGKQVADVWREDAIKQALRREGLDPELKDAVSKRRFEQLEQQWFTDRAKTLVGWEEQEMQKTARAQQIYQARQTPTGIKYNERKIVNNKGEVTGIESFEEAFGKKLKDLKLNPETTNLEEQRRIAEAKQKFSDEWNWDRAEEELAAEETFRDPLGAIRMRKQKEIESQLTPAEQAQFGRALLEEQRDKLRSKAAELEKGGLTDTQKDQKNKQLDEVNKNLQQIDRDLGTKTTGSPDYLRLEVERDELRKIRERLERALAGTSTEEDKQSEEYQRDRKAAEKEAEQLKKNAADVETTTSRPVTDSEVRILEQEMKQRRDAILQQQKKVSQLRPAVPQELRRELRAAINEKKKEITSDSWQEQLSVLEDAVRKRDVALAAAALLRATEYGNENEILSSFGYDSDAQGLKKFMEDIFQKRMHVSEDQALAIATDVAYTGEKQRHWGVARATGVDAATGRQIWQKEQDRNREVLAEIRKVDFEDFVRRTNRLGWGKEVVGLRELGEEATPEQRAAYFRQGGSREFVMSPYAQAFLADNFAKMMRNLGQGRFNVNLAVKLMGEPNEPMMQGILQQLGDRQFEGEPGKMHTFNDLMRQLGNYASKQQEQRGEFDLVDRFLEDAKRRGAL